MQNQETTSAPASVTAAEIELAKFVADNRQKLPPLPERPVCSPLPEPETDAQIAEREAAEAKRSEQRRLYEMRGRFRDLVESAGDRYRECTFDNFQCSVKQQTEVVKALRQYVAEDATDNVILFGPVGTGKDHLAFAICRAAIKAGKTVRWINGQTWFGMVRDAMDTDKPERVLVSELSRPDVLCLSDPLPPIGALTQHQSTMLYRVVDGRYSRGLPTVCTINVAGDDEADTRMGAATWDRLTHGAWKLKCAWPTHRKPKREIG